MTGGPLVVDYLVNALRSALTPNEHPHLGAYFRASVPLRLQAFVAGLVIPPVTKALLACEDLYDGLQAAETMANAKHREMEMDRLREQTVRIAQAILEGKPLPRRRRRQQHQPKASRGRPGERATYAPEEPASRILGIARGISR